MTSPQARRRLWSMWGVFLAPRVLLKGGERGLAGGRIHGLVYTLQRRCDGLPTRGSAEHEVVSRIHRGRHLGAVFDQDGDLELGTGVCVDLNQRVLAGIHHRNLTLADSAEDQRLVARLGQHIPDEDVDMVAAEIPTPSKATAPSPARMTAGPAMNAVSPL